MESFCENSSCFQPFNHKVRPKEKKCIRSSRPEVFSKKGVLRNFAKFTVKQLCQERFFYKVAGLRSATLLKRSLWHRCFLVNFAKFLRTPFCTEHLRWLVLMHHKINKGTSFFRGSCNYSRVKTPPAREIMGLAGLF